MDNENEKLYIPYGLSTEQELFTGFGKREMKQCAVGIAAFGILAALLYIITAQIGAIIFTLLLGIAGSIMMCRKDQNTRISVIGQIANMVRFSKGQKKYRYVYKSSWL